jgi:hypothetical protein
MSTRRIIALSVVIMACASLGCFASSDSSAGDYTYMDDDLPAGERCATDTGTEDVPERCEGSDDDGPAPGAAGAPCDASNDCNEDLVCAAPFDRGERGTYACVDACIELQDESRWCADASACCDAQAVCTARGYCIRPESDADDADGSTDDGSDPTIDGSTTGDEA